MEIENCSQTPYHTSSSGSGFKASALPDKVWQSSDSDSLATLIAAELAKLPTHIVRNDDLLSKAIMNACRRNRCMMTKRRIGAAYRVLCATDPIRFPLRDDLRNALVQKAVRSASGIINISVVMPPDRFSCKYNCKFCPNETIANGAKLDMPRSYLSNEDAVARANQHGFDPVRQTHGRFATLEANGHTIDKIEFRVLGGTFSCYSHDIADEFIRDLYYAANTYQQPPRDKLSIAEEQEINTKARIHVVGLGVETRPDEINESEVIRFRNYGVTRVELGIQHTDDALLKTVNRGHGVKASKKAVKLLKDYGFKVELHIMTDLPGATPEGDKACYEEVLQGQDLIPDYMKDYPCLDVSFTEIKKWKEEGKWKPYAELEGGRLLNDVLIHRQSITPPWVRVNRIQRDFRPAHHVSDGLGYTSETHNGNLGDVVKREAERCGIYCQCIRCCEVKNEAFSQDEIEYTTHSFVASGGLEYFISTTVPRPHRPLLLGFIRLRISSALKESILPELVGNTAMIRELHVYGNVKPVTTSTPSGSTTGAQHIGIGKKLLAYAERIAYANGCDRIAVISGIGVRDYYRKRGYELKGTYMIKSIGQTEFEKFIYWYFVVMFVLKLIGLLH
jgi:ELP3 family radical SAM enzyme/protein acetyltransferase